MEVGRGRYLVLVESFESNLVAEDLEKLVKEGRVLVVVQNLLLRVLALLDVNDAHFQLGFDEDL